MKKHHTTDSTRMARDAASRIRRHDYTAAQRLIDQALALDPSCCAALNAKCLLLASTGRTPEAIELCTQTIATHPADPQAYYDLAELHRRDGRLEEALSFIERLFAKATVRSHASDTVRSHAYALCREVQEARATRDHEATAELVEGCRRSTETLTGFRIIARPDEIPEGSWVGVRTDWKLGHHVIHYSNSFPNLLLPHLLAGSFLRFESTVQALRAGKSSFLTTTSANQPFLNGLLRLGRPYIKRLIRQGHDPAAIARAAATDMANLLQTLYRCPIELIVESKLRERLPALAPAQYLAMERDLSAALNPGEQLRREQVRPRELLRAGLAFDCVRVLLHASLSANTTKLPERYIATEVHPLASQLWAAWSALGPSLGPGDQDRLVDAFAELTGLRQGYEWTTSFPPGWPGAPQP
jgi:hypothetical protein